MKLGDIIRKIDFPNVKKNYDNREDDPSHQLKQFKSENDNISLEDLKDAFSAFEQKVCVKDFPGEKTDWPYYLARDTAELLIRFTKKFLKGNQNSKTQVTELLVHTIVALLKADMGSSHCLILVQFVECAPELANTQSFGPKELAPIIAAAKINLRVSDEEDTSHKCRRQRDSLSKFFKLFSIEQYKTIRHEFLDMYLCYYKQLLTIPDKYVDTINRLLRDLAEKLFEEKNPYVNVRNAELTKSHLAVVQEIVTNERYDSEGVFNDVAENWLDLILKGAVPVLAGFQEDKEIYEDKLSQSGDRILTSHKQKIFDDVMKMIVEITKNDQCRQEGKDIYSRFRTSLFGKLDDLKPKIKPTGAMFSSCSNMVIALMEYNDLTKDCEEMIWKAIRVIIANTKLAKGEGANQILTMVLKGLQSGRKELAEGARIVLERAKTNKLVDWNNHVKEAKEILEIIGKKPLEDMQDRKNTLKAYIDILKACLEAFKRISPKLQTTIVNTFFDAVLVSDGDKMEIAEACASGAFMDFSKDKKLRLEILQRSEKLVNNEDLPWFDEDRTWPKRRLDWGFNNLLQHVVKAYSDGKSVTKEENDVWMRIFKRVSEGRGETIIDQWYEDNEKYINAFCGVWQKALRGYVEVHRKSSTLACIAPILPVVFKWTKIAYEEEHKDMMRLTFGILHLVAMAPAPEFKTSLPEVIDLMLETGKTKELHNFVSQLYPHNPGAVHSKLDAMFDFIENEDWKDEDKRLLTLLFHVVAQQHPEAFTQIHIQKLFDRYKIGSQHDQAMILMTFRSISEKTPKKLVDFFPQICDDTIFKPESLNLRFSVISCVGGVNTKLGEKAVDYFMKFADYPDNTVAHIIVGVLSSMVKKHQKYMQKYKKKLDIIESTATNPQIKDLAHEIILVLEGKSIENIVEDIEQQQEDIADLDVKVDATVDTVIAIGDKVIEHDKEIGELEEGMEQLEERVDDVEDDIGETKIKVEEIDNKTMTNAPKWSRDLTKLMNPPTENDWRLLASRLGYSNDDIRGWATQHDPCMALLSEWYATHKTSEASYGVLTALTEMNRMDGSAIVENAMKAADGVVEDEEFEYPSPPPVFISYQWGVQNEVKLLKQHLNMAGYECWLDVGQMGGGDKLFAKIDNGIRGAKIVICCVTEKYAKSPNCNREVNLSVNLNKPIIPLLMEKMDWPPKGSMGPIFSEYLFIRFFQRGGEETHDKDQRYWPIPKFQELLMQLNFFVAPDPKMVKKEYQKWWAPIVEDIVIDKKKGKNQPASQTTKKNDTQVAKASDSPLIFLSYQWGKQPQIKALYQRLTAMGYTVWMDIYQMGGGDSLYDKIDRGMRGCKAVVSCITQKYSLSANCRREVSLADALKKPIIPLMLEQMKWPPDGPMSMVFTELLYINFFSDEKIQMVWKGEKVNELMEKLKQFIPEITLANENKGKGTNKPSPQSKTNVRNEQPTEKIINDTKNDTTVSKTNGIPATISTNKGKSTRNVASNSLSKTNQPSNNTEQVPTPKPRDRGNDKQTNDIKSNVSNGMNKAKPKAQIAATENSDIKVSEEKGEPTPTRGNRHYKGNIHVEKDVIPDQSIANTNAKSPDTVTNGSNKTNKQDPKARHGLNSRNTGGPNSRNTYGIDTSIGTNTQQQKEKSMNQPSNNTEHVPSPKISGRGNDIQTPDSKNDVSNGMNKAKPPAQNVTTENKGIKVSEEKGEPTSTRGKSHYKGNIHVEKDVTPDQSIAKTSAKSPDAVTNETKKTNKQDPKACHGPYSRKTDVTETSIGTNTQQQKERSMNQPSNNTEHVPSPQLSGRGNDKPNTDLKNNVSNGMNKGKPTPQNATTENRDINVSEEKAEPTPTRDNRHYKANVHVEKAVTPDKSIAKTNGRSPGAVTNMTKKATKDDPKVHHGPNSMNTGGTETSVGNKKHQEKERPKNSADIKAGPKTEIKQQGPDKSKSPPKKVAAATNQNTANNQNKVRNEKQLDTESNKPKSTSCAIL